MFWIDSNFTITINFSYKINWNTYEKITRESYVRRPYCAFPKNYHDRQKTFRLFHIAHTHTNSSEIPHSQSWFSGRRLGNFSSATWAERVRFDKRQYGIAVLCCFFGTYNISCRRVFHFFPILYVRYIIPGPKNVYWRVCVKSPWYIADV